MYSILPGLVSLLFIGYGAYVLNSRGVSRISMTFFLVCFTTFSWQAAWAVLFQVDDPALALDIARLGYLPILFLPTTLYHFITELTGHRSEKPLVYGSYALAGALAVMIATTDWFIAGMHTFFFGHYPQAGWLHPLHLVQTVVVVTRGLYLLYRRQQVAVSTEKARLRYCLVSILIYFGAVVDYLCNYGVELYPPGVIFIATSLGLIAQAMVRHNLLADPIATAASIAHEVRTPLATIRSQSRVLARSLPELIAGYKRSEAPGLNAQQLEYLGEIAQHIEAEVSRSNFIVDMLLASARAGSLQRDGFAVHSVKRCVDEALACYPFSERERERVSVSIRDDFRFFGSDTLLVYVLYNLLKNALQAVKGAGRGTVLVECHTGTGQNELVVTDTGLGIAADVLPHVFDPFYTTRHSGGGTGMGLAFCHKVITAFGGTIGCESVQGSFTRFTVGFPTNLPSQAADQHIAEHYPVPHQAK
ncbi:sensor histidine kinase [Pseudoduganella chitinolytica]|uniref:histidine kinase n=1 Tax=Pseudoduganella chitinolytica TaxID=34070 RepID=A0ABY8B9P5_9BURK|nr:sensor histidine kinase [Pseudoduganella chitinolytica]WEF32441.1 ATP-binding protein [Pseudoduganella chitinolytica]